MAGPVIFRAVADKEYRCENGHLNGCVIKPGDPYCKVDIQPGEPRRRRSDWGYIDRYCDSCGQAKYVRYRKLVAKQESNDG